MRDLTEALQMDLSWGPAFVGAIGGLSAWAFVTMRLRSEREHFDRARALLAQETVAELARLKHAHLQETLRLQCAQWWANNAAESNTSESLRFTLLELALYALASESLDQVREMLTTRVATEPDAQRRSILMGALGELELRRPGTEEPWWPWLRADEERTQLGGNARWNRDVLRWWRGVLERGAYTHRARMLELAIDLLAALKSTGAASPHEVPPQPPGVRELLELSIDRRIVSNSRPLPAYGENTQ
jgi:hypothetical protein